MTYRKFKVGNQYYNKLTSSEREMLKILEDVVEDTDEIYRKQLEDGFFMVGITKQELEVAGKKDSEILSPFTYVDRKNGKLIAIPYHQLYAKYLEPIAQKIENAAKFSENKLFKQYLLARAKSLRGGSYKKADIAWLNVKNANIDFSIAPFERYLDKILFIKRSFQAHVGIIDRKNTELVKKYKDALYSSAKLTESNYHSTAIPKKGIDVLVEMTPAISGYAADVLFSIEHFPCDLEIALKHGSKTLIYASQTNLKFEKLYYPIFRTIFEKRFASRYSKDLLKEATVWSVTLYELGKQLHNFAGARERLQELYGPIDEANGFASGIAHSKHLVVKGMISQDLLEAIIIIHILWMFADWIYYLSNKHKESHVIGSSMLLNYYLSMGALKQSEGISWPNFSRIFFCIESMADNLSFLLQKGTYEDADGFIKKYADLKSFEKFSKNLTHINLGV
ncbi:hypothetical protein HYU94_02040 [Candidatus Daviesbacteria bacterium]|nr:hypothetical protein [Candidatus Daviesbacteria bacterium]